ncbi:MAG: helix-turn-helix domain-containing protein [Thiohalospira sp.]
MSADPSNDPTPHDLSRCLRQALDQYFEALDGFPPGDLHRMLIEQTERTLLGRVLELAEGNQRRAAEILGINRSTLRKKVRQYELLDHPSRRSSVGGSAADSQP